MQTEKQNAEMEQLKRKIVGKENRGRPLGHSISVNKTGPMGYQGLQAHAGGVSISRVNVDHRPVQSPSYTPATIPGLSPIQPPFNDELTKLRWKNKALNKIINDFKANVQPRLETLEAEMKTLKSKQELKMSILVKQRDEAEAEFDVLKNDGQQANGEQANRQQEHWETQDLDTYMVS
jgi:hypothetical protein